jgi:hypothetical protein
MSISTDRGEGTSNSERIAAEIQRAAEAMNERFPGYSEKLAAAAFECYFFTAEHGEQRININQKYDEATTVVARQIREHAGDGTKQ